MKPNILLIFADQMRWDCLGCAGNPVIKTPNLDKLAGSGILFRNAFSPDPICVPARASLMTGNYPQVCTGIKGNGGRIKDGQPLLTEVLKKAGYRAYACGKLHFLPYSPPGTPRLVHGFEQVDLHESGRIIAEYDPEGKMKGLEDYFDYLSSVGWHGYSRAHGVGNNDVRPCPSPLPAEHYVDHWIANCTIKSIETHRKETPDKPFFVFMSSPKPHSPYDPPRPYDNLYDPRQIPMPFGTREMMREKNPLIEMIYYFKALNHLSPQAWQVIRSYYYGCITFLDAMIGRVVDYLEKSGIFENTLIIFTADHGDLLGDFGSAFKVSHLNGSVRIPFIVSGPGVAKGRISDSLVGLQDILPTLADYAGVEIGQKVHGGSLIDTFQNPEYKVRDVFYSTTDGGIGASVMVTDGKWKYIYTEAGAVEEFYNQIDDIAEIHNLADKKEYQETLKFMRNQLKRCAVEFNDEKVLDGEDFVKRDIDRESFKNLPVSGMGWRWY
ncbi:MAG: sulfatase-like hydrolase/transferase [bacterium]|nr:sulfatase-like hydrolase/transferase [bacterium]